MDDDEDYEYVPRPGDRCRTIRGTDLVEHTDPCPLGYATGVVTNLRTGKVVEVNG